jgi:hypothetical protein
MRSEKRDEKRAAHFKRKLIFPLKRSENDEVIAFDALLPPFMASQWKGNDLLKNNERRDCVT